MNYSLTRVSWVIAALVVLFFAIGIQQLQSSSVVKKQQSRELNHKILKWLSPLDFRQRQQDVLSFRSPGTVNWFLEDNSYISWVAAGKNETLWLHGAPGTGKTVVASIAIDHLRKINNGNRFAVSFVFCDYKDEALQTPENMISAIIKEIVRNRPVSAGLKDFYNRHETSGVRPTLSELEQLLRSEAARLTSVYVVVDAVDELADKDSSREKFLDALSAGMPHLNVLFTSRPHIRIAESFPAVTRQAVAANTQDIRRYARNRMSLKSRSQLAKLVEGRIELQDDIVETLENESGGM